MTNELLQARSYAPFESYSQAEIAAVVLGLRTSTEDRERVLTPAQLDTFRKAQRELDGPLDQRVGARLLSILATEGESLSPEAVERRALQCLRRLAIDRTRESGGDLAWPLSGERREKAGQRVESRGPHVRHP